MASSPTGATTRTAPARDPLPRLSIEGLPEYLNTIAGQTHRGEISLETSDRLISCARALILATSGKDEPHTAQP